MTNPFDLATEAAAKIAELTGIAKHDIALTLGSGWAKAADLIGETVATLDATQIPGFLPPAVHGHVATIRSIKLPNGKHALILGARSHYYEGHGVRQVAHGVRTAAATGANIMILTNGAGGKFDVPNPPAADAPAAAPAAVAPAAAAPAPAVVVAAAPAAAAPAPAATPVAASANGEALYKQACMACHAAGVAGAPKLGDKAAWSGRLGAGVDGLTASVIKGKGAMPPKGGAAAASDADIKAAVAYMVDTVK